MYGKHSNKLGKKHTIKKQSTSKKGMEKVEKTRQKLSKESRKEVGKGLCKRSGKEVRKAVCKTVCNKTSKTLSCNASIKLATNRAVTIQR